MSNIVIALEITALGMGLVFSAIILLWWMMALLTRIMSEKEDAPKASGADSSAESASGIENDFKAQAAAVAVALAFADQQASHAHPLPTPPTAIVSAWQLGMRTRQLSQKGVPISRRPRKVG